MKVCTVNFVLIQQILDILVEHLGSGMGFACDPSYGHFSAGILVLLGTVLPQFLHSFSLLPPSRQVNISRRKKPSCDFSLDTEKERDPSRKQGPEGGKVLRTRAVVLS